MILSEIIAKLERRFPIENKENWDNVGLLIGTRTKEIKKIQISLDVTDAVIENAIRNHVDLIISHHPLIFLPIKAINDSSALGKKIIKLIENRIAVYSMHTNLDSTRFGLNDLVGEKLGLYGGKIIDKIKESPENGIGRVYSLLEKQNFIEFIEFLKEKLNLKNVTVSGLDLEDKIIKKIAIVNGAGSSYWKKAKRMGADVLVTGDLKYHEALDAKEEDMAIVDVGHYESEHFFNILISECLSEFNEIELVVFNDAPVLRSV